MKPSSKPKVLTGLTVSALPPTPGQHSWAWCCTLFSLHLVSKALSPLCIALSPCHLFAFALSPLGRVWLLCFIPQVIFFTVAFIIYFSGMGPMPWTVNSEIYPLWARSTGNACSAGINWIFNVLVSLTFLHTAEYLTYYGKSMVFFSALSLLFLVLYPQIPWICESSYMLMFWLYIVALYIFHHSKSSGQCVWESSLFLSFLSPSAYECPPTPQFFYP